MSRRSSKFLPLLLLVLVAGLGLAAWTFLQDDPVAPTDMGLEPAIADRDSAPGNSTVASLPSSSANAAQADRSAPLSESERHAQATAAEAELVEAIWLEGRVVFPEGTPYGEVVEVVALGRKFQHRELHRTQVESNGRFKVAFAKGTTSGRLDVEALHLFLDKPMTVRLGKLPDDLVIEPFLGGALRGELRLAPEARQFASELVGKTVRASAWSNRWSNMVSRGAKVDEKLRFEMRGLPPELGLKLEFDSNIVGKLTVEDLRVPAGETLEREFDVDVGVRVLGKLRSGDGALPKNSVLQVRITGGDGGTGSDRDNARINDDGSFDIRGLTPGKIELTASAPQRVTAKLDLGQLENGAVREGVELVLGMGHSVSGRVVWPDKTPAVDARVVATGGGSDDDSFNPFDSRFAVRSNANGEFEIAGLNEGPYGLLAQAKPVAEESGKKQKGPTWKARLENVAADTHGMEVLLVAGYTIEGIVVDDVGAPVKAFGVIATPVDEGKRSFNMARMVTAMFKPDDGRFELGGLLEGGYTLRLNVFGHDDPPPLDVRVPNPGTTYTLVAPRRAVITGLVVKPDGSPATRAEVNVYGSQGRWSDGGQDKANNQGEFEIKAAQTGKIRIEAKLAGFAPSESLEAELGGGESLRNLRLVLRVGGRITGEVLPSRTGERVDARKVTASARQNNNEQLETTTDRGGKFEFEHLAPGEYTVAAEAAQTEIDALRSGDSQRNTDWELLEATKKRATTTVADGGTAHVVLGAPPVAPVVISGTIRRGSEGVAGMRITAQSDGERGWERRKLARSDEHGMYQVTVDEPGKYQIQVTPGGRGGTMLGTHVEVPAGGLGGVDFALASGQIAGKVSGPDGEELGWVQVQLARSAEPAGGSSSWTGGSTQTDSEGAFAFKDVPAGQFTITVSGTSWNRRTFEQRQYGKVKQEISLSEGQQVTDLDILLEAAGSLKVTVQLADGSAAGNGRLEFVRTDGGGGAPDSQWFGRGEVTREDLEPGTYQVRAECQDQVSSAPETVRITASETTSVTLRLRAGGWVRVKLVDAEGKPVQATARIADSSGRALTSQAIFHEQRSAILPAGTCRVIGTSASGQRVEVEARVEAGETADAVLTFS